MDFAAAARAWLAVEAPGRKAGPDVDPGTTFMGVPGWSVAVAISVASSALMVFGLVLQKRALVAASRPGGSRYPRVGDIVISPTWAIGFLVGVLLPVPVQIFAYSLAPMSLTTPLSGVTVAMNTILAPRLLGERLQPWPDLPGSALILIGTALTTVAGDHSQKDFTFAQLLALWYQVHFVLALAVLLAVMAGSVGLMSRWRSRIEASAKARPGNPNMCEVLLPALVAAGCGCIANIALKGLGELLQDKAEVVQCSLWLVMALLPACVQLNYISRGLRLYQQTVFFPVYNSLLVLTNTAYGLIFYREYDGLLASGSGSVLFFLGILLVMMGVALFARRTSDEEAGMAVKRALTEDAAGLGANPELGLTGDALAS